MGDATSILERYKTILSTIRDRLRAEDFAAVYGLLDEMDRVIASIREVFEQNPELRDEMKSQIQEILKLQEEILSEVDTRVKELSGVIRDMPKLKQAARAYVRNKK